MAKTNLKHNVRYWLFVHVRSRGMYVMCGTLGGNVFAIVLKSTIILHVSGAVLVAASVNITS